MFPVPLTPGLPGLPIYRAPVVEKQVIVGEAPMTEKERDTALKRTQKKEADLPTLSIISSQISLYSWEEMFNLAGQLIVDRQIKDNPTGYGTVNSPYSGEVSLINPCRYCQKIDCQNHQLLLSFNGNPIVHPGFTVPLLRFLRCICQDCGSALISKEEASRKGFMIMTEEKRLAAISEYCATGKVICLRRRTNNTTECRPNPTYETGSIKDNGEVSTSNGPKPVGDIITLFDAVPTADAEMLGFPNNSHRNMIVKGLLVIPVIARPEVIENGISHLDQLTVMYGTILAKVQAVNRGAPLRELFNAVKYLIYKNDGKTNNGMRDFLSITERIQGKTALLRGLLMGKRVNQCGRTVSGPDASLKFGQVRIPKAWAPILIKSVRVTEYNIHYLQALLAAGKITHITPRGTYLRKAFDSAIKCQLQIGDVVDRHLQNGDRIVINRQPTLHRQSMMAYEVVLGNELTIGLHLSYTTPMNNDFDGDENNAWNPQDFEVEAESEILLNVINNMMSQEQNRPIMGLVMNSITGIYLLSDPSVRVAPVLFEELLGYLVEGVSPTFQDRLRQYGVHPLSGQALISAMLPDDFYYTQKGLVIINGILISGLMKKGSVGPTDRSIIHDLYKNYGARRTANFFTDAPWVINKWLLEVGFSVGILDLLNLDINEVGEEYDRTRPLINKELERIYLQIDQLGVKADDPTEEALRQRRISGLLNAAQGVGLRLAKEILKKNNSVGIMTEEGAGTKGANANIGQMLGLAGQQNYRGERLKAQLSKGRRLLPTFDLDDESPSAHAFVEHSYYEGLTPEELFFIQSGSREGLLDTALKTAETGSLQHRLIKALENMVTGYDGSVRNTSGTMFSPSYNGGFDIGECFTVTSSNGVRTASFIDIRSTIEKRNIERGWMPKSVKDAADVKRGLLTIEECASLGNAMITARPAHGKRLELKLAEYSSIPRTKLTKFEKARVIGTRAMQLSMNAEPIINIGEEIDPVKIALQEYDTGDLNIHVLRKFPNGDIQEVWPTLDNINIIY